MTIKELYELSKDHPYYCAEINYHAGLNGTSYFNNWDAFYSTFGSSDFDRNLVFRFDIGVYTEEDCANIWQIGKYYMSVFMIHQRKGAFRPIRINVVCDKDVPAISAYLQKHFDRLNKIWAPFSIINTRR